MGSIWELTRTKISNPNQLPTHYQFDLRNPFPNYPLTFSTHRPVILSMYDVTRSIHILFPRRYHNLYPLRPSVHPARVLSVFVVIMHSLSFIVRCGCLTSVPFDVSRYALVWQNRYHRIPKQAMINVSGKGIPRFAWWRTGLVCNIDCCRLDRQHGASNGFCFCARYWENC